MQTEGVTAGEAKTDQDALEPCMHPARRESGSSQRRAVPSTEPVGPPVERHGAVVTVRYLAAARQVLRARDRTTQAGFTAEAIPKGYLRHHPILISDGPLHDEQRSKVARFLAPKVVAERYTARMQRCANDLLDEAVSRRHCSLDEVALRYTVGVTAELVGLTESSVPAMARRLVTFFNQPPFDVTRPDLGRTRRQWARAAVNALVPLVRFHLADVRPALRARRRQRRQDIISHLLDEGYGDLDVLVECVTYGTAGMVTTREFIAMAAWHLLSTPELAARYRTGDEAARFAMLHELIRLEPVVGHLYRRVQQDFEIGHGTQRWRLRSGDLVDVAVRHTNTDAEAVGARPLELRPARSLPPGVNPAVLSFGDGAHKCPGQPMAILESDVFLRALLEREPRIAREPTLGWDDLIAGYCLRDFQLGFGAARAR